MNKIFTDTLFSKVLYCIISLLCILYSVVPYINRTKVITEITFERGDTVRLDCPSLGRPAPTIQWTSFTTNQSVDEIIHEYQRTSYPNGSLAIKYLNDTDEGAYMCTAVNDVGSDSMHISLISREAELRRELQGTCNYLTIRYTNN